jgi:hypothetical protein
MKNNLPLIVIGFLILLGILTFVIVKFNPNILNPKISGQSAATSTDIMFFFRSDCPHCLKVEQFMAANNVEQKIKIDKKQVYSDKVTPESIILDEKAAQCGIAPADIGTPFVWDGPTGKCYEGEDDVINFLKAKLGQ